MRKIILSFFLCVMFGANLYAQKELFRFSENIIKKYPEATRLERLINNRVPLMERHYLKGFPPFEGLYRTTYAFSSKEKGDNISVYFCFCDSKEMAIKTLDYHVTQYTVPSVGSIEGNYIVIVRSHGKKENAEKVLKYFVEGKY